ncbi:MAG TPA: hypothetical protein VN325_03500 [Steroidobacteraceae bacterium]|nr:hypothetical protein [Steroidobacteraceae bacterium]
MTIREYIERRAMVVVVVIVLALLVFPDAIAMFGTGGMLVGLVPIFALYYAIGRWTNCPRCKGSLSKTMTEAVFTLTNVPDKCPHCSVSLDAPTSPDVAGECPFRDSRADSWRRRASGSYGS